MTKRKGPRGSPWGTPCNFDSDAVVVFGGGVVAVGNSVDEFLTEERDQDTVFERGDNTPLF